MKYVIVEWIDDDDYPAYRLDPKPYLERLPQLAEKLPSGARDFVLQPSHYEFGEPKSVKNLKVAELGLWADGQASIVLRLSPNPWMHTSFLTIEYQGVSACTIEVDEDEDEEYPQGLDRLLLDEILPHVNGCTHEIKFTGGLINITCKDLTARWEEKRP
ncbi:hypothetical protein [Actinomadura sp. 6N118]|uniref:hypothetical protein n=1 Tax=Actinomadura sp. 6N118 TaxID=3375151 RepID=UPI003789ACF6